MPGIEEKENTYRVRQRDPGDFAQGAMQNGETFATIQIADGVKAVIGKLKSNMEKHMEKEIEELKAKLAAVEAEKADMAKKLAETETAKLAAEKNFSEAMAKITEMDEKAEFAADEAFVDSLVKEFKLKPADKDLTMKVLKSFPKTAAKFAKDGKDVEVSAKDLYKEQLARAEKVVSPGSQYNGGADRGDAPGALKTMIMERMKEKGLTYSLASYQILKEHPELNKE